MDGIKRNKDEDKPVQSDVYMWNYIFRVWAELQQKNIIKQNPVLLEKKIKQKANY